MTLPWYTLEIKSRFVAYSAQVNDITQATERNLPVRNERAPINAWIKTGSNAFDVLLWMIPSKEARPEEMGCSVQICRYEPETQARTLLAQVDWKFSENEGQGQDFPVTLSGTFQVETSFPEWDWESAEALSPDFQIDDGLRRFLETAHRILATRDVGAMADLGRIKAVEMAAAFGIPLEERLRDQREFFEGLFRDAGYAMKPMDWEGLRLQRHAQGKLWEVTDRMGNPAVSTSALEDGASFGLNLFLCRKGGTWFMCR